MARVLGLIGTGEWYVVLMEMKAAWGRTLLWFFHVWCFEEVNAAIISCHCFLLLHLWGMGVTVKGLQSASAPLLTALHAYMQKDKKAAHWSMSACVRFFQMSPLCAPQCNCTYLRDTVSFLSPCSRLYYLFFSVWDFQASVAVRACFIRGIFMGGECSLSYWCSSLAFCEAQWALLIDYARQPMMWHRGMADM